MKNKLTIRKARKREVKLGKLQVTYSDNYSVIYSTYMPMVSYPVISTSSYILGESNGKS